MNRCIVGFSTSNSSWISKVIRFFRKSEYSHTFVYLGSIADIPLIGEASTWGVQISPLHVKKTSRIELWEIQGVDQTKLDLALSSVMSLTGKSYGYFQLIGFIWIWLLEKLGLKAKSNPFQDGIICSEYVYYFLKAIDYIPIKNMKANEIAPDDELNFFRVDPKAKCVAQCDFGSNFLTWV